MAKKTINYLKSFKTYLAGPIDRAKDSGMGWRKDITPFLKGLGITVIDPTTDEGDDVRRDINNLKKEGRFDEIRIKYAYIAEKDLGNVKISDFIICYIDMDVFMCGTFEELFMANQCYKPCLIVCEQSKYNLPSWICFNFPGSQFFSNFDELRKYLDKVNQADFGEDEGRARWIYSNNGSSILNNKSI